MVKEWDKSKQGSIMVQKSIRKKKGKDSGRSPNKQALFICFAIVR